MPKISFIGSPIVLDGQTYTTDRVTLTENRDHKDLGLDTVPDPNWSYTDSLGHFHAYNRRTGVRFPTLRKVAEHVPCTGTCYDDECDGTYRETYRCVICGEEITVGTKQQQATAIEYEGWSMECDLVNPSPLLLEVGREVSVRVAGFFGVARVFSTDATFNSDGTVMSYVFIGVGALGVASAPIVV